MRLESAFMSLGDAVMRRTKPCAEGAADEKAMALVQPVEMATRGRQLALSGVASTWAQLAS